MAETLHDALRARGLGSRETAGPRGGRILTQDGRDIGSMTAWMGWCLVRLYDGDSVDDYPWHVVRAARRLLAGVDRPAATDG